MREMYPTKGYLLWMNDPGTLIMLNAPWADDYGFGYLDGIITTSATGTAANEQSEMSYGGMPHTNSSALYAYNRMTNDSIFYFNGHGVESYDFTCGGAVQFWDGNQTSLIAAQHIDTPNFTAYYIENFNTEINDILLAVYVVCYSGTTNPHLGNLVEMTSSKGADNVIGFRSEIDNYLSNYWSDRFWYRCRAGFYGNPQMIPFAANGAKTDVLLAYQDYGGVDSLRGIYHYYYGQYDYLTPARYGTI